MKAGAARQKSPVILVAVDASPESLVACEQAVSLARGSGGSVRGLFVEDADLLNWAASGLGREVSLLPVTMERPDRARLLAQLVAQAHRAEEALAALARDARVEWSFEVARGPVTATVGEHAERADTVVLGRVGRSHVRGTRIGSTARRLARAPHRRVLIASAERNGGGRVRVLLPPHAESESSLLEVASEFARATGAPVEVVAVAGTRSVMRALSRGRGPVIIAGDDPRLDEGLLDGIRAPVLLVGADER